MANIDLNQYEKMYGYTIGKLINGDTSKEITKSEKAIFDNKSLNFHFYPSDEVVCNTWATEMDKMIDKIKTVIEDNDEYAICKKCELIEKNKTKDKIYFYIQKSGNLRGTSCNLFKYISTVRNGNLYELNFMRFYIDDNKVNCIVKAVQFDRIVRNEKTKNITKEYANQHGICYPKTDEHHKSLQKLINTNKNKNFFYNPQVDFGNSADEILKAFVDFINACECKNPPCE